MQLFLLSLIFVLSTNNPVLIIPENLFDSVSNDDYVIWHPELQIEYNQYQMGLMKQKIRKQKFISFIQIDELPNFKQEQLFKQDNKNQGKMTLNSPKMNCACKFIKSSNFDPNVRDRLLQLPRLREQDEQNQTDIKSTIQQDQQNTQQQNSSQQIQQQNGEQIQQQNQIDNNVIEQNKQTIQQSQQQLIQQQIGQQISQMQQSPQIQPQSFQIQQQPIQQTQQQLGIQTQQPQQIQQFQQQSGIPIVQQQSGQIQQYPMQQSELDNRFMNNQLQNILSGNQNTNLLNQLNQIQQFSGLMNNQMIQPINPFQKLMMYSMMKQVNNNMFNPLI